jgi:hypothetical protein
VKSVLDAQKWIVGASLVSSGTLIAFFWLGPQLNFPLETDQARHLLQLVIPPFFGYLALAVRATVAHASERERLASLRLPSLLPLLLKGTMFLYIAITILALVVFYLATSPSLTHHSSGRWTFEDLSWAICLALALQATTFAVLVSFLFKGTATPADLPEDDAS